MNAKICLRLAVLATLMAAVGCGSQKITVSGKLVENGEPFTYDRGKDRVDMRFIKLDNGQNTETTFPVEVFEDGRFELRAESLPPGSYRVTVEQTPYLSGTGAPPGMPSGQPAPERFGGRFAPAHSKIIREITASTSDMVIDLGKQAP